MDQGSTCNQSHRSARPQGRGKRRSTGVKDFLEWILLLDWMLIPLIGQDSKYQWSRHDWWSRQQWMGKVFAT